jgi:hypothetical protein
MILRYGFASNSSRDVESQQYHAINKIHTENWRIVCCFVLGSFTVNEPIYTLPYRLGNTGYHHRDMHAIRTFASKAQPFMKP